MPWKSLPPDRVTTLMAPDNVIPVERSKFTVEIWNSSTPSWEKPILEPA